MLIVCGTDFTSTSAEAAHIAAVFAHPAHGRLTLVNVYPPTLEEAGVGVLRRTLEEAATLLAPVGTPITPKLIPGETAAALQHVAAERDADLIVVGASRVSPLTGRIGSVAARLLAHAFVPTLVVARPDALATDGGARSLDIVVAASRRQAPAAAVGLLQLFAAQVACRVCVVHVLTSSERARGAGDEDVLKRLRERFRLLPRNVHAEYVVSPGRDGIEAAVADIARERGAAVVMVGRQPREAAHRFGGESLAARIAGRGFNVAVAT